MPVEKILINILYRYISLSSCMNFFSRSLSLSQTQLTTGPTPAQLHLQRMASSSTWRLDCTAAKEKVPLGLSEHRSLGAGLPMKILV